MPAAVACGGSFVFHIIFLCLIHIGVAVFRDAGNRTTHGVFEIVHHEGAGRDRFLTDFRIGKAENGTVFADEFQGLRQEYRH